MNDYTLYNRNYAAPIAGFDQIVFQDDSKIVTRKAITINEPFFIGHYPQRPIFPGVFIIESVIQSAKYLAKQYQKSIQLSSVRTARFFAPVLPGDCLECSCECTYLPEQKMNIIAECSNEKGKVGLFKLVFTVEEG
jgi:3-hydroxyacyl-[acyl-carrier-protein] dehydratase